MALHQPLLLDLTQEIEHFLGSADRKGRNDHIAATVKGFLQYLGQHCHVIHPFFGMKPVSVGGFHYNIIGLLRFFRILDERLVNISDITGKNDLTLFSVLIQPYLDTGGTQQMPDIRKTDINAVTDMDLLLIRAGN